jgi:riboflavin kinase
MVMSVGYNPFYNNTTRSAEVHVLHAFSADFYGAPMRLLLLDLIRPERGDYSGLDELVADIRFDCEVARRSLDRPAWSPAVTPATGGVGRPDGVFDVQWLMEVGREQGE